MYVCIRTYICMCASCTLTRSTEAEWYTSYSSKGCVKSNDGEVKWSALGYIAVHLQYTGLNGIPAAVVKDVMCSLLRKGTGSDGLLSVICSDWSSH